jgi:hypothetical protein
MLALVVVGALVWACHWPMPFAVRVYLLAQLVYIPPVWLLRDTSWYRNTYCVFTAVILATAGNIVWEALSARRHRLRVFACAFLLSLTFAHLAFVGLARPMRTNDWIVLSEGFLLLLMGILLAYAAAHLERWDIALLLGLLWIFQGAYDFGWVLDWPRWMPINWIAPAWMEIIAFTLLGWRLRLAWLRPRRAGEYQHIPHGLL